MNTKEAIKATIYVNGEKICSSYFQAVPRVEEYIEVFNGIFQVKEVHHYATPVGSTDNNGVSWNLNQPTPAEIRLSCTRIS